MNKVIINDNHLSNYDIHTIKDKVRAILLSDNQVLISNYGGVVLLPGGSVDTGETSDEAIIRELKEETGILYDIKHLEKVLSLIHYQPNYPTRNNEIMNRLIKTKYYLGEFRGIDLKNIQRTDREIQDNFHLQLVKLDEFMRIVNQPSTNPRKKFFDRENEEVIKVLKKIKEVKE